MYMYRMVVADAIIAATNVIFDAVDIVPLDEWLFIESKCSVDPMQFIIIQSVARGAACTASCTLT